MPRTEPLPCPFCGAPPVVEPWHGGPATKTMVSCDEQDCHAGMVYVVADTATAAIELWNVREAAALEQSSESRE